MTAKKCKVVVFLFRLIVVLTSSLPSWSWDLKVPNFWVVGLHLAINCLDIYANSTGGRGGGGVSRLQFVSLILLDFQ